MTLFSLYEQKLIRLTDNQGNTFTGVADTFPAEYGLHEYGREEEGIQLGEYVIYRSQILTGCLQKLDGDGMERSFNQISQETAKEMIAELRPKCDVIVALMHMGLDASSTFTSEFSLKYIESGTSVKPFSRVFCSSSLISRLCSNSLRLRSGSTFEIEPFEYGAICTLCSQTSPPRTSAKQSVSWQLFSRSERTSVPVRAMPASYVSRISYSWSARRFFAMVFFSRRSIYQYSFVLRRRRFFSGRKSSVN